MDKINIRLLIKERYNNDSSIDIQNVSDTLSYFHAQPPYLLRSLRRILNYLFIKECRQLDLEITHPQLEVLLVISAQPGIDQVNLSRGLGMDRSTTVSLVDILERHQWVKRSTPATDRRRNVLVTTDKATKILKAGSKAITKSSAKLLAPLSRGDANQLLRIISDTALRQDSSAPLWQALPGKTKTIQSKLNLVYNMPAFLLDRCLQIEAAYMNEVAKEFKLTYGQVSAQLAIGMLGPIDQGSLSYATGANRSSLSIIIPALIKRGLVTKEKDPLDKRRTLLHISQKGIGLIEQIYPHANEAIQRCFSDVPLQEKQNFCSILARLTTVHENVQID